MTGELRRPGFSLVGNTLEETLDNARRAVGAPAAVLALRRGGGPVRTLACGLADSAQDRAAVPDDTFSVGSLTKPCVALVVLQLCNEGVIGLDSVLADYKVAIPHSEQITVRQMLMHTSGVFNFGEDLYGKPLPLLRAFALYDWTFEDVRQIIAAHEPSFAPGADVKYSNSNYILLGQVVERASGELLGAHMRRRIFTPLGLKRTYYMADEHGPRPSMRGYAQAHWGGDDVTELETYRLFGPGGGIVSNSAEMLRVLSAVIDGELLPAEWHERMLSEIAWDSAGTAGMSLGLQHYRRDWGSFRGHGGNTHGYTAGMWQFPDDDLQLVFGVNRAFVKERPLIQPFVEFIREAR